MYSTHALWLDEPSLLHRSVADYCTVLTTVVTDDGASVAVAVPVWRC